MAMNKKYLLLAIILFGFLPLLFAQTEVPTAGYFIQENGDEVKYIQRFVWSGGEYALHYEVIFEREINGTYTQYLRQTTTSKFIELSLPVGAYRFRVIPYDILGRPAEGSAWVNVQVLAVNQPEQNQWNTPETSLSLEKESEPEIEEEAEAEEPEKTVFFRIGLGIGGERKSIYGNEYFGDYGGDPNVGLRTSIVFKTPYDIYIGPELTGDINRYGNLEYWKIYFFTLGLNFLAEKWSPNKIFGVGLKFGLLCPSIDIKKNYHGNNDEMEYFKKNDMIIIATEEGLTADRLIPNIGTSFYFLIKKHLLIELGFNYLHVSSATSIDPAGRDIFYPTSGFFCSQLAISYQF
jgi:hypothetical protein